HKTPGANLARAADRDARFARGSSCSDVARAADPEIRLVDSHRRNAELARSGDRPGKALAFDAVDAHRTRSGDRNLLELRHGDVECRRSHARPVEAEAEMVPGPDDQLTVLDRDFEQSEGFGR